MHHTLWHFVCLPLYIMSQDGSRFRLSLDSVSWQTEFLQRHTWLVTVSTISVFFVCLSFFFYFGFIISFFLSSFFFHFLSSLLLLSFILDSFYFNFFHTLFLLHPLICLSFSFLFLLFYFLLKCFIFEEIQEYK